MRWAIRSRSIFTARLGPTVGYASMASSARPNSGGPSPSSCKAEHEYYHPAPHRIHPTALVLPPRHWGDDWRGADVGVGELLQAMKDFKHWTDADVAMHNLRVSKENRIPGKLEAGIGASFDKCDKESDLHNQILDECRRRGWIALHGSMASPTRRTEGEPDFVVMGQREAIDAVANRRWLEPAVWFVEVKTRTGKLSPAQQAFHAHAEKLGHTVHVVRSFDEFLKLL